MKQKDEKKDAKVLSQEELENIVGGKKKPYPPFKEK
jgi:bacteriocin-like protein